MLQEKKRVGEKRIAKEAEKSQGNPRSQKLSRRRGINKKTKHVKKMNNSLDWTIWKILGTFESGKEGNRIQEKRRVFKAEQRKEKEKTANH